MLEIKKIVDLDYNELITLEVIENTSDLCEIFTEDIKISFSMLKTMSKENELTDEISNLLKSFFDKIILTKKEYINKYLRLADSNNIYIGKITPITNDIETVSEIVTEDEEETVIEVEEVNKVKKVKKPSALPRRYGKNNILKDIEKQGGKATNVQLTALSINNLKNMYVNLNNKLIKDMLLDDKVLTDEDYRLIRSAISIVETKLKPIFKK